MNKAPLYRRGLYDSNAAAEYLSTTVKHVDALVREGELAAFEPYGIRRGRRILLSTLDDYIDRRWQAQDPAGYANRDPAPGPLLHRGAYDASAAAEYLSVSKATIGQLVRGGHLPAHVPFGMERGRLVTFEDLDRYCRNSSGEAD